MAGKIFLIVLALALVYGAISANKKGKNAEAEEKTENDKW